MKFIFAVRHPRKPLSRVGWSGGAASDETTIPRRRGGRGSEVGQLLRRASNDQSLPEDPDRFSCRATVGRPGGRKTDRCRQMCGWSSRLSAKMRGTQVIYLRLTQYHRFSCRSRSKPRHKQARVRL